MDWIEKTNRNAILCASVLGAVFIVLPAHAQVRGMGGFGSRPGAPVVRGDRGGFVHNGQRRFFGGSALLSGGCFDPSFDDFDHYYHDDESDSQEVSPVQVFVESPAQPPAPPPVPANALVLEYQDGQYVRIPTGGQLPSASESKQAGSEQTSTIRPGTAIRRETALPSPALPHAVLIFRDGHREEIEKYVIHNDIIHVNEDYWTTGSWTRSIPIALLDVPATLKLNQQRGGKFNLPSRPSEVAIRF
jgi:hypothetical protein